MSGTPPNMTTLVGIAQRGWSGQICDLSHLWVSFLSFFLSILLFFQRAPMSHFLTDRHGLYANTRVSGQACAFWGSRQYPTTCKGHTTNKPPQNRREWAFRSQISEIVKYRSLMKILASNFTERLVTGNIIKNAQFDQRESWRGHVTYF